jgi:hypothetical protein
MQAANERRLHIVSASIDQLYKMASINPRVDMKRRELIDILLEEEDECADYIPSEPHVVESDDDDEDCGDDVYDFIYSDDEDV